MIRIKNFSVPFDAEESLALLAAKRLRLPPQAVLEVVIVRKAIDARRYKGAPIQFVYILDVHIAESEGRLLHKFHKDKNVDIAVENKPRETECSQPAEGVNRPVIVGFGPAGMLAALTLARKGWSPLVLERGHDVDKRHEDIRRFWQGGELGEDSNVQFGEGGAGTFSDGKLTTRISDVNMDEVLDAFIQAGAPAEIKYLHKPHIGTDLLRQIVKNIRKEIIRLGGEVRFEAKVTDIELTNGRVCAVIVNNEERIMAEAVLLGIGHSARDTYEMLYSKGISMEAKAFAIGVRIEHPQGLIDKAQYGEDAGNPLLPPADYAMTYKDTATKRGAYSFCMCPGGQVVAAASEKGRVVTNGMSNYCRDSGIANSALLVNVMPQDFGGDVLNGMYFQRKYEEIAFHVAGDNYFAPVQSVGDFLLGKSGSREFLTRPTYLPGVHPADLHNCLPGFVTRTLESALPYFGRKIAGFADTDICLTGVETRSSAPCRICRDQASFVSNNTQGLYPMGEGAGYAGGIMSAAVDGINTALAFLSKDCHNSI